MSDLYQQVLNELKADTEGALRYDEGKARFDLLSVVAMEGVARVLEHGVTKYGEHNWRKGMAWGRVLGSMLRHTYKFMGGEDLDSESGLPHVDHIMTNAMFLSTYYRTKKELDDRYIEE